MEDGGHITLPLPTDLALTETSYLNCNTFTTAHEGHPRKRREWYIYLFAYCLMNEVVVSKRLHYVLGRPDFKSLWGIFTSSNTTPTICGLHSLSSNYYRSSFPGSKAAGALTTQSVVQATYRRVIGWNAISELGRMWKAALVCSSSTCRREPRKTRVRHRLW